MLRGVSLPTFSSTLQLAVLLLPLHSSPFFPLALRLVDYPGCIRKSKQVDTKDGRVRYRASSSRAEAGDLPSGDPRARHLRLPNLATDLETGAEDLRESPDGWQIRCRTRVDDGGKGSLGEQL